MIDGEIRVGTCTALVVVIWGISLGLLVASWATSQIELGFAGICTMMLGGCLIVIRDNDKTRRVIRAVAREPQLSSVRSVRD
jgi:hypothetical protein